MGSSLTAMQQALALPAALQGLWLGPECWLALHALHPQFFDDESMDFQTRILHKSGLSEETFFPPGGQGQRAASRRQLHCLWGI